MPNKFGRPDPKYTQEENISGVEFLPDPLKRKIYEQKRKTDELNKFRGIMTGYPTMATMPEPGVDNAGGGGG